MSNKTVTLPNKTIISVDAIGVVQLAPGFVLHNVSYVPQFNFNLLSVSALLSDNCLSITFFKNHFLIQEMLHSRKIGKGNIIEGLYVLFSQDLFSNTNAILNNVHSCHLYFRSDHCNAIPQQHCNKATLWHTCFRHVFDTILRLLSNKIPFHLSNSFSSLCDVCPLAKFKQLSFVSHNNLSNSPFDLLHCDVWEPYGHDSYDSKRFFLTLADDCSRFTWLYLLKHKSEAAAAITKFFAMVKTQVGVTIKCLCSDNARELALTDFLNAQGTVHQFSCVERLEQNLVVERKHQHLLNVARALFFQSKVPIAFWGECVATTTYLINRVLSPVLKDQCLFWILYGSDPNYKVIKSFGCLVFPATLPSTRNKFSPRAHPCIFVGYPARYKGYHLYNLHTQKFLISRDVVFLEGTFSFHTFAAPTTPNPFPDLVIPLPLLDTVEPTTINTPTPIPDPTPHDPPSPPPNTALSPYRSTWVSRLPAHLSDYVLSQHSQSSPIQNYYSLDRLNPTYDAFFNQISSTYEP